ncbi:MAG: hypothetical protein JWQ44_696 [Chthoniobacter sp.]|jgi:hypothetical protein|nr:hypothetical protein [Chthoniobacter sp.]
MFMGQGIRGNRMLGATDAQQFSLPADNRTLACDRDKGIRPEHLHSAGANLRASEGIPWRSSFR